jgi:hypothetical protein
MLHKGIFLIFHSLWFHVFVYFIQDPIRWKPLTDVVDGYSPTLPHLKGLQNGDTATSAIKQVICTKISENSFINFIDYIVKLSCLLQNG